MTILINLFIRSVIRKYYHGDIKYNTTLDTMFSVVIGLVLNLKFTERV